MKTPWIVIVLCLAGCGAETPSSSTSERDAARETRAEETATSTGAEVADTLNSAQDRARAVESVLEKSKGDIDAAVDAAEQTDDD